MSDDNIDDDKLLKEIGEFDDNLTDIPEADAQIIYTLEQTASKFNNSISDVSTFGNKFEDSNLKLIATQLHKLFSPSESELKFSKDNLQTVEKAISVFIDEILKINSSNTNNQEKNDLNENQEATLKSLEADNDRLLRQTTELRRQNEDLLKRAKTAEETAEKHRQDLESITDVKETLHTYLNQKNNECLSLRKTYDQTTSDLKNKIDELEDSIREEKDKNQINTNQIERYRNQLDESNSEIATLKADNTSLKTKYDGQATKIDNLKQELSNAKFRIQNLEAENQKTENANNELKRSLQDSTMRLKDVDSSGIQNLQQANAQYKQIIDKFNVIFEEQSKDKEDLDQNHKRAIELLIQQQSLLSSYEEEMEVLNKEKNDLETQSSGDERLIRNLREKLSKTEDELNNYRSDEQANQLNKIRQMLKPRFGEDADVSQTVQGLLNGTTDNEMKQMNQCLFQLIDNILTFWTRIINEGNVKNVLNTTASDLTALSRSTPPEVVRKEEEKVKTDLLVQIARYRQVASQNSAFEFDKFPSTDQIQSLLDRLQKSDSEFDKQTYYIISAGAMTAEVLRNLYDRANSNYKSALGDLQPTAEILNFDTEKQDIKELPKHVTQQLEYYTLVREKILKTAQPEDVDSSNFYEFLKYIYNFIYNSADIINKIDSELRPLVVEHDNNKGEDELNEFEEEEEEAQYVERAEVIERAVQMLTDFINQDKENNSEEKISIKERDILTQSFDEDKSRLQNKIDQLNTENESTLQSVRLLEKENNELKKKVESLSKELKDEKQKNQELADLKSSHDELLLDMETLRANNEALRKAMENKSRLFDQRVNKLMEEERNQHKEDLRLAKERSDKREEKLKQELNEKTEKAKNLKKQLKNVLSQYEAAFKKQKETTAVLKKQNQDLNDKLSKMSENAVSQKESDRLQAEVKTLQTEKLLLSAKLKQAQENVEKIQTMRDNYWLAQMTVRESELNKSVADASQQAADHFDNFFDQVVTSLEQYLPLQSGVDEDTVIETLSNVVKRLETAETAISNNKENNTSNLANSASASNYEERNVSLQSNSSNNEANSKVVAALREWDRWARDLFVNFTDGEVPCQSCKELRFILGEMILTSISNRKIILRLESLRAQKKFLLDNYTPKKEIAPYMKNDEPPKLKALVGAVLAQFHIMKRYGYSPIGLTVEKSNSGQQSRKSTPKSSKTTPKKKSFF